MYNEFDGLMLYVVLCFMYVVGSYERKRNMSVKDAVDSSDAMSVDGRSLDCYYNKSIIDEVRSVKPDYDGRHEPRSERGRTRSSWAVEHVGAPGGHRFRVHRFPRSCDAREWVNEDPSVRSTLSSKMARKAIISELHANGWCDGRKNSEWHALYYSGTLDIWDEYLRMVDAGEHGRSATSDGYAGADKDELYTNKAIIDELSSLHPVYDREPSMIRGGNMVGYRYMWAVERDPIASTGYSVYRFRKLGDAKEWVSAKPTDRSLIVFRDAKMLMLNAIQRSGWRMTHSKFEWRGLYYAGTSELWNQYVDAVDRHDDEVHAD